MSGIFGLWRLDGRPVEPGEIHGMSARLAHRGPDDHGIWSDGPVALGHRMLHTTPESLIEKQPLSFSDAGLVLTADARVDNRDDLIGALGLRDRRPEEITDAELILRAYERWGQACPERIIGDFAFAIWDARKRELFCARDPMGVKPFYYHHAPGRLFAWASEAKGLLALADIHDVVNETQVALHLEALTERTSTFIAEVFRLPSATWKCLSRNREVARRYWRLDPEGPEIRKSSDREYAEAFLEIFREAVRARVRSVGPVCSALSGGLDSSSIACVARDVLAPEMVHALSAIFPSLPRRERELADESQFMDIVLATGGMRSHRTEADSLSPLAALDETLEVQGEPYLGYNLYLHRALYGSTNDCGSRVFLDGIDGDGTVSHGLFLLDDLATARDWETYGVVISELATRHGMSPRRMLRAAGGEHLARLAREGRWSAWLRAGHSLRRTLDVSALDLAWSHGAVPLAPTVTRKIWRRVRGRPDGAMSLVHPELARQLDLSERRQELMKPMEAAAGSGRALHCQTMSIPEYQYAMEVGDRSAAAVGIEPRYPFFDRRLIEFCTALPLDQKLKDGWTRSIHRRALRGILPDAVRLRLRKQNLSPNFVRGIRIRDQSTVLAMCRDAPALLGSWVAVDRVRRVSREFYSADVDFCVRYRNADAKQLFLVTVLARWRQALSESSARSDLGRAALDATSEVRAAVRQAVTC